MIQCLVECESCHARSETFDPFLDISLDVRTASTVEEALKALVRPEQLSGTNAYQCEK
jgi:ubiquitin carboxyl-terminal hydrolase 36/42